MLQNNNILISLYKKDSKGKIRFLSLQSIDGEIKQSSGLLGGALVERSKMAKPKNVGKSNQTTIEEQARIEVEAMAEKKLKAEYFKTIEEAKNTDIILYMGAKNFEDHKHKIKKGTTLYISRKYDGMRCLAHVVQGESVKLMSRENTDILEKHKSMMHLIPQLLRLPTGVYDGELFNTELGTFQKQMEAVKKYRPGISEQIDLNIYDVYNETLPYDGRHSLIVNALLSLPVPARKNLKLVPQYNIPYLNDKDINGYHDAFVADGFEGAMVRVLPNLYECNKKSMQMLKVKNFHDIAAEIIDIIPQDADPTKGQVIAKAIEEVQGVKIGTEFKSGCAVSHSEQQKMLSNKKDYIGLTGEFRFFETTDSGDLRHAHYHGIRLDK